MVGVLIFCFIWDILENLVKMNLVAKNSLGIKVWDTLLYLPRESDVATSSLYFWALWFVWFGMCSRYIGKPCPKCT